MFARGWLAQAAGFAALVVTIGCSSEGSGSFATVSGVVTHNGAPVDGAKVNFYSTVESGGQTGGSYSAQTDSSGKYVLAGLGKDPGIPPGMYKVTITKMDIRGDIPQEEGIDEGQFEAAGGGRNTLPRDYESVHTTKLSATLDVGKNENVNFELKGKASNSTQTFDTP